MSNYISMLPDNFAVVVSLIAASVALGHLFWFIYFQYKDVERWKILNNPNIVIDDVYVVAWRKINNDELKNTNWGYNERAISIIENKSFTGEYRLLESLLLWDEKTKSEESNQRFLTRSSLEEYVKIHKLNPKDYSLRKDMYFQLKLKNIGVTSASNLSIEIKFDNPTTTGWDLLSMQKTDIGIPQNSYRFISNHIFSPIELTLPEPTKFFVNLKYKNIQGEDIEINRIRFDYHPKSDGWTIGE